MNVVKMYGLKHTEELQKLRIPKESQILSVCVIHEQIKVAVMEDVNASYQDEYRTVEFAIFNQHRQFHVDNYAFLGTILLEFGNSIYHVFYRNV